MLLKRCLFCFQGISFSADAVIVQAFLGKGYDLISGIVLGLSKMLQRKRLV